MNEKLQKFLDRVGFVEDINPNIPYRVFKYKIFVLEAYKLFTKYTYKVYYNVIDDKIEYSPTLPFFKDEDLILYLKEVFKIELRKKVCDEIENS